MANKTAKSKDKKLTPAQHVRQSAESVRKIAPLLKGERKRIIDDAMRARLANEALTLSPYVGGLVAQLLNTNSYSGPIRKAFAEFGLDPQVPRHWRVLLGELASAHFEVSSTDRRYLEIRAEFEKGLKKDVSKNVVEDLAKRYEISTRSIWKALERSKNIFGY